MPTYPNASYTGALTTSLAKYFTEGGFADEVFKANRLLGAYKAMGAYVSVDGGESVLEPLLYNRNPSVTSSLPYDTIPLLQTEELTWARFPWAQETGAFVLSEMEMAQNQGESQLFDTADVKRKSLVMTTQEDMNSQLINGNAAKASNILGLDQLIEATGTVGGIDSSTNTWWRSTVNSSGTALTLPLMESAWLSAFQNLEKPNLIVTTQALYQKYMDLAQGKLALDTIPTRALADLGFEAASYKGTSMIYDVDVASGDMYFLNLNTVRLRYIRGYDFKTSPERELPAQWVYATKILWIGQHTIRNRRLNARLRAKTT